MVLAMLGFAIEDSLIRIISSVIPFGQVLSLFGLGGALIFALLCKLKKQQLFLAEVISRPMVLRMFFELIGRLFYSVSLILMPISLVTLVLQATPIFVVTGAAFLFKEASWFFALADCTCPSSFNMCSKKNTFMTGDSVAFIFYSFFFEPGTMSLYMLPPYKVMIARYFSFFLN